MINYETYDSFVELVREKMQQYRVIRVRYKNLLDVDGIGICTKNSNVYFCFITFYHHEGNVSRDYNIVDKSYCLSDPDFDFDNFISDILKCEVTNYTSFLVK